MYRGIILSLTASCLFAAQYYLAALVPDIPSQFVSESSIDWDFVAAYKRAEEEGREAAFIAWAEYTGECDYDTFDDAYRCKRSGIYRNGRSQW